MITPTARPDRRSAGARPLHLGLHIWPQATSWPQVRAIARRAEAAGYRYVFTWDHLYAPFGDPYQAELEGWTLLAALAEATTTVELGLLVSANPFRNPGLVAKMAATVDAISGGRAVVGIGAAWYEEEHRAHGIAFGATPGERLRWLEESVSAIRALLAGDSYTSPEGGHYAFLDARHQPLPVRGRLPMLIGGGGEQRTLRIVAEHADLWNVLGSAEDARRKSAVLDGHCRAIGRPPEEISRGVTVRAIIRDRAADAIDRWDELLRANGAVGNPYLTVVAGRPTDVADHIRGYVDAGFDTITLELPAPYDDETVERLAADVLPLL